MGLLQKIQAKTEEARAKEKIRPLLESRMMRDILWRSASAATKRWTRSPFHWLCAAAPPNLPAKAA